jgi:acyl-CoA synthetase (NDP forming)
LSVATVFMSTEQPRAALSGEGLTIPSYPYPENAAYALGHAVRYGAWRAAPAGRVREFADICAADLPPRVDGESRWLAPNEVRRLLTCYGLPVVEEGFVPSGAEAREIAATMSGPYALKGVSTAVVHKSEARGVRLDLATPADVEQAAREMTADYAAAGHAIEGFMVQPMVPSGIELLVGVVHDRLFGPVVACAIGGTQTELLKDVSVRITPLTDVDAAQMVRSLATYPLLDGYRGAPPLDVAALEEVLLRVSALVEAHPEIAEMDLNPVIVLPRGAVIVDARIRIEPAGSIERGILRDQENTASSGTRQSERDHREPGQQLEARAAPSENAPPVSDR